MKKISMFWPSSPMHKWEMLWELAKKLSGRWIGQGPAVDIFEFSFGEKFGYEFCVSTNSGTSALELAYHLAGIKKGDKVLVPVFTCTATNIPLIRRGAQLIFCDINPQTWCPEGQDVISKMDGAKAIVLVNLGGIQCSQEIYMAAKERGIPVIVDCAQSLGITEQNGDYLCYSFQAIKHFTTGDGGMLIVRNSDDYQRAKRLRWFGIDREAKQRNDWQPYKEREMIMDIIEPGYKFHMNDIMATMGIVGLRHSDQIWHRRHQIARVYDIEIQGVNKVRGGSYWLYGIEVDRRDEFAEILKNEGVETNVVQLRNDIFSVFGGKRKKLPNMNALEDRYIYLPIHPLMSVHDALQVSTAVNKALCALR